MLLAVERLLPRPAVDRRRELGQGREHGARRRCRYPKVPRLCPGRRLAQSSSITSGSRILRGNVAMQDPPPSKGTNMQSPCHVPWFSVLAISGAKLRGRPPTLGGARGSGRVGGRSAVVVLVGTNDREKPSLGMGPSPTANPEGPPKVPWPRAPSGLWTRRQQGDGLSASRPASVRKI